MERCTFGGILSSALPVFFVGWASVFLLAHRLCQSPRGQTIQPFAHPTRLGTAQKPQLFLASGPASAHFRNAENRSLLPIIGTTPLITRWLRFLQPLRFVLISDERLDEADKALAVIYCIWVKEVVDHIKKPNAYFSPAKHQLEGIVIFWKVTNLCRYQFPKIGHYFSHFQASSLIHHEPHKSLQNIFETAVFDC